ncbi:MAG: hypothetical protein J5930_07645 [Treponema sp.]|nr:hypothetical protein [Treponema sp.]
MSYAALALCFIPLLAVYVCMVLLVPGFKKIAGLWACALGLLSLVPIQFLLTIVGNVVHQNSLVALLFKFLLLSLIEETGKMALMFLLPEKKTPMGAFFAYAMLCGLSLGCFEAFVYLVSQNALWRFSATVIHSACAALSGLFVYAVRKKKIAILPFLFAVLFHGVYNYFTAFDDFRHYFAFVVILIAVLECRLRYGNLRELLKEEIAVTSAMPHIKGDVKKMGLFDSLKGLFKKNKETEEGNLPEQTVFGASEETVVSQAEETVVEETQAAVEETVAEVETAAEQVAEAAVAPLASDESEAEEKIEFSQDYPKIDNLFDDEKVSADVAPVKEEVAETVKKTVRKTAAKTGAAVKKTAKTAAEKATAAKTTAKKAGTKAATAVKKTAKAAAEKATAAKTTAKKTSAKAATAVKKTAKAAAEKATSAKTTAKKAGTKAATAVKKTAKAAAEKTTAAKTTAKKTAEKAATAAKKTTKAAAKTAKTAVEKTAAKAKTAVKKTAGRKKASED